MGIKIEADEIEAPQKQGWGIVHLKQGQRGPADEHSHPYDEYVVMLSGRCVLRNAGTNVEYGAGEIGFFPRNQPHRSVEALEDTTYIWTRGDSPDD